MYPARSIDVAYLTADQLKGYQQPDSRSVIGVVQFSQIGGGIDALPGIDSVHVMVPPLGDAPQAFEVWRAAQPLEAGRDGLVHYRSNSSLLFGCIAIAEADAPLQRGDCTALEEATERAYREIFRCIDQRGFPHLWRIWNYLPDINREADGTERYRQFNAARRRAFLEARRCVAGNVPAACALGSAAGSPMTVYFLASTEPATPIENPRQVSAYEYPPQYGRASPAFSRAVLSLGAASAILLISGTASIVGYRTVHDGNAPAQTREAVENIRALVAEANRIAGAGAFDLGDLAYKVYLRRAADLPACAAELRRAFGPGAAILYLRADICRSDLLVEIEAVGCTDRLRGS